MGEWKGYSPDNRLAARTSVAAQGPASTASAGALTYEPYYGLRSKPFSLSTDPRALYTAPSHAEALDDLLAAIRRREGLIVVTGEMGTGKTTLCRAALYQLDRKTFTTVVPDPLLSREDLLRTLLVDFGEVSFDELRNGRLANASRPDLNRQLYEFLTSLESVDAFAVLVIDEAQHLGSPLVEEIRALSELEAGRRLLQIVLIGQPELESHLRQPNLRQLDQRVTTRCALKPFSREELVGYVSHRLALAGGTRDRVSFSPAALDVVYRISTGIPRVINLVCDRALLRGHHEQVAVISPAIVGTAIEDLRLASASLTPDVQADGAPVTQPGMADVWAPVVNAATAPPAAMAEPRAAQQARPASAMRSDASPVAATDLTALMDLAPTARPHSDVTSDHAGSAFATMPAWKSRVAAQRTKKQARLSLLRMLVLPLLAMGVMLVAAAIAFNLHRLQALVTRWRGPAHPVRVATLSPPSPVASSQWTSIVPVAAVEAATASANSPVGAVVPVAAITTVATPAAVVPGGTWLVQVAAFASSERASGLIEKLTAAGMPAYEAAGEKGGLHIVRLGPYEIAADANAAAASVRQTPSLEGAFVLSTAPAVSR